MLGLCFSKGEEAAIFRQGQGRDSPKEPFPTHCGMKRAVEGRLFPDGMEISKATNCKEARTSSWSVCSPSSATDVVVITEAASHLRDFPALALSWFPVYIDLSAPP